MAGDRTLWKAFCRQTGIVPVCNLNEWVDAILAFSLLPPAQGRGVFIVGGGGGNSVIFADSCARAGLDVPVLSPESMGRIRPLVPVAGSIAGNPLDFWEAFLNTDRLLEILDTAYGDPGVHAVIVDRLIPRIAFHSPDLPDGTDRIIDFIFSHPRRKPTVFTIDYDGGDPELLEKGGRLRRRFCEGGIPAYPSFERAIGALSRFVDAGLQGGGNGRKG
jgi:acyl-CoA synthetase (NDP forming)